jgi:hypothetical protein
VNDHKYETKVAAFVLDYSRARRLNESISTIVCACTCACLRVCACTRSDPTLRCSIMIRKTPRGNHVSMIADGTLASIAGWNSASHALPPNRSLGSRAHTDNNSLGSQAHTDNNSVRGSTLSVGTSSFGEDGTGGGSGGVGKGRCATELKHRGATDEQPTKSAAEVPLVAMIEDVPLHLANVALYG